MDARSAQLFSKKTKEFARMNLFSEELKPDIQSGIYE